MLEMGVGARERGSRPSETRFSNNTRDGAAGVGGSGTFKTRFSNDAHGDDFCQCQMGDGGQGPLRPVFNSSRGLGQGFLR